MKFMKKGLSALLVFLMVLQLFGAMPVANAATPNVDVVFMSDLHNANGGYLGFKQMVSELKNDGQSPRVFSHGGDYVEDSMGGTPNWQTQVYDVIHGTELETFPDASQAYTLGNHDWESGTFGGNRDKEAAFKEMFGFDRCGLAYSDDEMEIYMIGAQGETGAGGGGEAFIQADIDAFDAYLASVEGSGKVIFLQTHWPAHSAYNFKQRVVTNSDKVIDVINSHAEDTDIVWIWGHNHYEDEMRYTILKPGDQIMYAADTNGSSWGNPRNPQYKTIKFTYANAGCMNDMWYKHSGHNDTNASTNYRGPSACLSVAINNGDITFTYNRIRQENEANGTGAWVYSHDANIQIYNHNVLKEHPATVVVDRKTADHEHNFVVSKVVAPTCTEAGYTLEKCSICDRERTTNPTEALGHDWDEGTVTTEATTEHAGVMTFTCRRCGETKTARIPKIPTGEMDDIDFTDPSESGKFEVVNKDTAEITEGTGLILTPTADAFEPVSAGWGGDATESTPKDLIKVPVSGDWTATTKVDFDVNNVQWAMNSYFSFLAMQGEDYQNMAGIRGTNNVFQDYLRQDGTVNTNTIVPTPGYQDPATSGFTANGTYYLRLDKAGTTYTGSWSADGETFTELFKMEDTGIDAEYIVLDAYKTSSMSFGGDASWLFTLKSLEFGEGSAPSDVDYTALNKAIADAEKIDKTLYTDASVARLESALTAAKAAKTSTSQSAVDAAAAALNNAIAGLVKKSVPADGEYVLADTIEAGKTYVIVADGQYALNNTVASFGNYSDGSDSLGSTAVTIADGKITSAVDESMLWTINAAEGVQAAIDGRDQYFIFDQSGKQLLRRSGSTSTAPFSVGTMDASKPQYATFSMYQRTDGSYTVYVNSYRDSDYPFTMSGSEQGFNAPGTSRSTWEGQIETYQSSIRFYLKGEGTQPVEVDYTALQEVIGNAEKVDKSLYTAETVAALETALTAAKSALTAEDQETVDNAAEALAAAIAALELKPVEPPVDGDWVLADTIEAGKTYVIVSEGAYAMINEAVSAKETYSDSSTTLGAKAVTIEDGVITSEVDDTMQWTFTAYDGAAAYDGLDQYYIQDTNGKYVRRGSMSQRNGALILADDTSAGKPRYYAWSFKAYDGMDATYAMYTNSENAYGTDYPGRVGGNASGFDLPSQLEQRSDGDPFAFMNDGVCSHITLYTNGESSQPQEPADKTALNKAISDAEKVEKDKYTDASVAALDSAVASAKKVQANEKATQKQVDAAAKAVNDAINGLVVKPEPPVVDKSNLAKAIEDAEKIDKSKYTDESVAALEAAVADAKNVQNDAAATQNAVDNAAEAVNDAVKNLKPKDDDKPFRFDDVNDEGKFYFDPVYWAFEANPQITNGVDKTHFGPDNACTRGHVVTFLWRAAGCPEPKSAETPFKDLKEGAFYEKAVAWAVENEITNGMSADKFAPDAECNRGQIVTFLWRFKGEPAPKSAETPFKDLKKGAFYEKAVAWAVENEITNGMSADKFGPDSTCTRGQVVTFLYRATKD